MKNIKIRAKIIIIAVSLFVSTLSAIGMLLVLRNQAEKTIARIAEQETWRVHNQLVSALESPAGQPKSNASINAVNQMVGGMFEWVELYSVSGKKLAEASTEKGAKLEHSLLPHKTLNQLEPTTYVDANSTTSILRIIIPVFKTPGEFDSEVLGFVEVGREVPAWRKKQIQNIVIVIASIAALSALITGLLLYPSIMSLLRRQRENAQKLFDSHIQVLDALGLAVAKRESGTGVHNYRVTWIAATLGEAMGLSASKIKNLIAGSFLHDVGKIATPDQILLKPGKLTDDEMTIMKEHVSHGEDIVKNLGWFSDSLNVVSCHHEKWDGSGYPRNLNGDSIPIEARIFAVADVFDALCSKRPYKDEIEFSEAVKYINEQSGKHFDPTVVTKFENLSLYLYEKTHGLTEQGAKNLVEPLIAKYFSVDFLDQDSELQ